MRHQRVTSFFTTKGVQNDWKTVATGVRGRFDGADAWWMPRGNAVGRYSKVELLALAREFLLADTADFPWT